MAKNTPKVYMDETAVLENVQIIYPNFSGRADDFNREGNRNFNIILNPEVAEEMEKDGWAIRWQEPREEGDDPRALLNAIVKFGGRRTPKVVMVTGRGQTVLDERTIALLDSAEIVNVDVILRPYNWTVGGKSGVKAYVKSLYVTIEEDPLEAKYGAMQDSYDD